jgi:predicted ATPase
LLQARSEGNPYFAEQILVYLKEENLLEMSSAGWSLKHRMQETALPTDLRALLVSRLDQLPRRVRDVIQTASVLGREFSVHHLAGMLSDSANLQHEIVEAERAHVWLAIRPFQYFFTHALLRDAAYAMQTHASRVKLHGLAVQAMEWAYRDDISHHYGELAHHAERADLPEKAFNYLHHAAKAAADAYQNSEAVDYYTRALAFMAPDALTAQFDLLAERVELYSRMGKRDLQWKDLAALERWAEALADQDRIARALMMRSSYYFVIGSYMDSIECAQRAGDLASAALANSDLALYTQVVWITALLRLGRLDEAMQRALETLNHSQAVGNRKEESRTINVMGLIALERKEPETAQDYFTKALAIAREINDLALEARTLSNHARSVEGRDYVLARKYYEASYEMAHKIGDRVSESYGLGNIGFAAGSQGDFVAARFCYEQALMIAREIGNPYQEITTLINLSALAGLQNESQSALQSAQLAAELAQKTSDPSGEAWAQLYLGHALSLQNELDLAQAAYRKSIAIRDKLDQPSLAMEPIGGLLETHLRVSDFDAAGREAEKILQHLATGSTLDGADQPLRVYYACYLFLKKKKDPRSRQILQTAKSLLEAQASKFNDQAARQRYIENIPWRRAIREEELENLS